MVDHRPVGEGKIGPISSALQQLYFNVVRGRLPEYRDVWCTSVYAPVTQQTQ
jgi:branched-chain amino acid aminotransferase